MKKLFVIILLALIPAIFLLSKCNTQTSSTQTPANLSADRTTISYDGYKTPQEWGQHIVTAAGCGDCHTPKSMSATGRNKICS